MHAAAKTSSRQQKVHFMRTMYGIQQSVNAMANHRNGVIGPIFFVVIYALLKQFIRFCSRIPRTIYLHYDALRVCFLFSVRYFEFFARIDDVSLLDIVESIALCLID